MKKNELFCNKPVYGVSRISLFVSFWQNKRKRSNGCTSSRYNIAIELLRSIANQWKLKTQCTGIILIYEKSLSISFMFIFWWEFLLLWRNFDNFMRIKLNRRNRNQCEYIQYNVWRWETLGMRKLCYKNTSKPIKMVETLIMENENAFRSHCFVRIEWMCLIHVYSKQMTLRPKKYTMFYILGKVLTFQIRECTKRAQNLRLLLEIGQVMQWIDTFGRRSRRTW